MAAGKVEERRRMMEKVRGDHEVTGGVRGGRGMMGGATRM